MVADTTCLTHTGCRDDNLRLRIEINRFGIITGNGGLQSREGDRINALTYQLLCGLIEAALDIPVEDVRCFNRKRAVYIDLEVRIFRKEILRLDLSYEI